MNLTVALIAQSNQESGGLLSLLLPLLLLGPLVYLMIVPQRKQKKRHAEFVRLLEPGADVVTSGGVHGTITFVEDDIVHMQVDTDVVIRVAKSSVARREGDPVEPPSRGGTKSATSDEA